MNSSKFIPFNQDKKEVQSPDSETLALAMSISIESGKLLECISNKDNVNSKTFALQLKHKLEQVISNLSSPPSNMPPSSYVAFTGTTHSNEFKHLKTSDYPEYVSRALQKEIDRQLDNGGMAPPKEWRSITDLKLKSSEQYGLIEEMRKLNDKGISVSKSTFHHKSPATIEEFTEPFKYMENMHDYNGAFLITLLKTKAEITNQAATMQVDISSEENSCAKGDKIILSVYDISGSVSSGEEKKFLITLMFDKLHGTLKFDSTIFMNGKKVRLSSRQLAEVDKFCKAKKINK